MDNNINNNEHNVDVIQKNNQKINRNNKRQKEHANVIRIISIAMRNCIGTY
jgi:hypothetical protein